MVGQMQTGVDILGLDPAPATSRAAPARALEQALTRGPL